MFRTQTRKQAATVPFLVAVLGCATYQVERALPEARPLGREHPVFKAPTEPAEAPKAEAPRTVEAASSRFATRQDAASTAEPKGALGLREALALALMQNPELAAFSWEVRAAEAAALQEGLPPNPELSLEIENIAGTGATRGIRGAETTLSLGQAIELGGKRLKRFRAAALKADLAGWDYEAKRLDVLTEATKAFVDVLAGQQQVALSEDQTRAAEQTLTIISERVKGGKVSPVEELRAKAALATSRIELEQARRELEALRARLAASWGSKAPHFQKADGPFEQVAAVPPVEQLERLLTQNPDVARWAIEMAQRRAAIAREESRAIPDVTLSGGVRYSKETEDTTFVVGVSVPLPLFDRNQGSIREARYGLAKATEERRAAEVKVRTALTETYQTLASALNQSTALKNDVFPAAQSAFDAAREGYRQGKMTYLDILDAQQKLFEAKGQYVAALAGYHKATADLERLIGQSLTKKE